MIKRCITFITRIQLNILSRFSITGSLDEAEKYLNTVHPYVDVDIEANNKIREKKRYDLQIIMSAYNVDRYIKQSIESVLCQKTKFSYVLTIINDGSTDSTWKCLEHYKDCNNINILNQNNKGVSSARNRGLQEIQGKYVMFLDSDDCLCEGAVEKMLERAFLLDADIVEGSVYTLYGNNCFRPSAIHQDSADKVENNLWGYSVAKVIKAEIFKSIKFPEKYYFEDTIFSYCIYPYLSKKYTISDFVYKYRKNFKGISISNRKKVKMIDTYWIMGYMWNRYGSEKSNIIGFQEKALNHMVLCFKRTEKLGSKITQAGFLYLSGIYLEIFKSGDMLSGKYQQMDRCVREKLFLSYRVLCKKWRLLI